MRRGTSSRGGATQITQEVALLGTPAYMAPEQAMSRGAEADARTDIFALGAIAYTMLAGRPPFSGESIPTVLFKICSEEASPIAPLRPDLDPAVDEVIGRAMRKSPEERYASPAAFARALAEVLVGERKPERPASASTGAGVSPGAAPDSPGSSADPIGETVSSGEIGVRDSRRG